MGFLSNVKKQYCISFFHSLIPAYVIERLFWQQRGMTVQMVVYAEIIYAITVVLLEVPSGILADRFGRKKLLALYCALEVFELALLLFAHSFWHFALAVFLAGVGKAFSSGSCNALLYDSLLAEGRQNDFERVLGRVSALEFTGALIAALSGSVLPGFFGFEFNYILSVISMFAAFIVTLTLREPPMMTKPAGELSGMRQYAGQSLQVFCDQPFVLLYCLTGAVLGAGMIYLDEFWQIVLEGIGVPVLFFGVVGAALLLIRIPGNLLAYRLKERLSFTAILSGLIVLSAAGYISISALRSTWCIAPMVLVCALTGVADPLIAGYLHHRTESHIRATVESFSSLGMRMLSIIIGLCFGYISESYSIFAGYALLGAVCALYFMLFSAWHSRTKKAGA